MDKLEFLRSLASVNRSQAVALGKQHHAELLAELQEARIGICQTMFPSDYQFRRLASEHQEIKSRWQKEFCKFVVEFDRLNPTIPDEQLSTNVKNWIADWQKMILTEYSQNLKN